MLGVERHRLGQLAALAIEPVEALRGIVAQLAGACHIVGRLGKPPGQLLLAPLGVPFLALQARPLGLEATERRGADRLGFAQGLQRDRGVVMPPGGLGQGAGRLGEQPHHAFESLRFTLDDGGGLGPAGMELHRLEAADRCRQLLVPHGLAGLALQAVELLGQLADDIVEPGEIVLGGLELQLGIMAAGVEPGDAGCLLQNAAARLGLGIDDLADLALADERRRAGAGRGVGEQQLDVAGADFAAVDAIGRAALAVDAARHLDHVAVVEAGRRQALGIVDGDRDLGDIARRARGGTGEDDVVHSRGAHALVRALAHHPAQGL